MQGGPFHHRAGPDGFLAGVGGGGCLVRPLDPSPTVAEAEQNEGVDTLEAYETAERRGGGEAHSEFPGQNGEGVGVKKQWRQCR